MVLKNVLTRLPTRRTLCHVILRCSVHDFVKPARVVDHAYSILINEQQSRYNSSLSQYLGGVYMMPDWVSFRNEIKFIRPVFTWKIYAKDFSPEWNGKLWRACKCASCKHSLTSSTSLPQNTFDLFRRLFFISVLRRNRRKNLRIF